MIELKQLSFDAEDKSITADYEVTHNNIQTILHGIDMQIIVEDRMWKRTDGQGNIVASLKISDCRESTIDATMEKLASWCERIALGIRERGSLDPSMGFFYQNDVRLKSAQDVDEEDEQE